MGRYDPLRDYLARQQSRELILSFQEIERIIGGPLPPSAYTHPWWWRNEDLKTTKHVQCRSWQVAGYDAAAHFEERAATFRRPN